MSATKNINAFQIEASVMFGLRTESRKQQILCGRTGNGNSPLRLGNRAFCVEGPVAWNSIPLHIRTAPTLSTFKNMLKTHLFSRSYITE